MIMKHLKIKMMSIAFMAVTTSSMAQSLNKMNWLNEPQQWEIKESSDLLEIRGFFILKIANIAIPFFHHIPISHRWLPMQILLQML